MIAVHIQGHDIYETLSMPEVPRKGDVLWLSSLAHGRKDLPNEVLVSKVEWARDQVAWAQDRENEGIHVWITVRRMKAKQEEINR